LQYYHFCDRDSINVRKLRYIGNKSGMISCSNQLDKMESIADEKL